jgi:hypothetical protein
MENVEMTSQAAASQASKMTGSATAVGGISLFFLFLGLQGFGQVFFLSIFAISAACAIGMGKMAYQDRIERPQN